MTCTLEKQNPRGFQRPGVLKNNDIKTAYFALQVYTCILKMNQMLEQLLKFYWL